MNMLKNLVVSKSTERALEAYDAAQTGREPAANFYTRVSLDCGTDIDLDVLLRAHRIPPMGAAPICGSDLRLY